MKKNIIVLSIIFFYINLNISTYAENYLKINIDKFTNNKNIDDEIWSENNKYFDKFIYFLEKIENIDNESLIKVYKNILSLDKEKYKKHMKFINMLEYETLINIIRSNKNINISNNSLINKYKHSKYEFSFYHNKYYFNSKIEKEIIEKGNKIYIPSNLVAYEKYNNLDKNKDFIKNYNGIEFEIYENIKNKNDIEKKMIELFGKKCNKLGKYEKEKNIFKFSLDSNTGLNYKGCRKFISGYFNQNDNIIIIQNIDFYNDHGTTRLEYFIISKYINR